MPGASSSQGNYLFVTQGTITSNSLSVYYTTPPMITGGVMVSKTRIYLTGSHFVAGSYCQYRTGVITAVALKGTTGTALNCDVRGITNTTISFEVRIYSSGQPSNWFTVPVPSTLF